MSRFQRMLIMCSLSSFAAGVGAGIVVTSVLEEPPVESRERRFARDYIEKFVERYDPTNEQIRKVRAILLKRKHDEMEIYDTARPRQLPVELQNRLRQAQQLMDQRIESILTDEQRELYRRSIHGKQPPLADGAKQRK